MATLPFTRRDQNTKKKLLLIKLEGLGDFIIFLPSLLKYREVFPGYEISLLVDNKINYEIANRYKGENVDNVILFDAKKFSKNIFYRFALSKKFYQMNFDTVINPIYYRRKISDFIVRATQATEKISFAGYEVEKLGRIFLLDPYTKLIRTPTTISNEFYRHKHLIEELAGKTFDDYSTTFPSKDSDIAGARKILSEYGIAQGAFVVIFPGAGRAVSKWPVDKFAKIAEHLVEHNFDVVICGSAMEKNLAEGILQHVDKSKMDHIFNLTAKTNIFSTAGIIRLAKFYIGNDSGPTHLAEAVGATVICPLGLGHFKEFYPSQDTEKNIVVSVKNMDCLNDAYACANGLTTGSPAPCVSNISTEAVINEIKKLI
ncbi:MAG: glycosyltransferase family 9 protein [Candidatus Pacebacteria bacterium]|jgi:ADP-heptose:LPS heptosyltransferase|nr:glycosyltransferase family 9 protein [Candidatus Paceibacterota bacterium]